MRGSNPSTSAEGWKTGTVLLTGLTLFFLQAGLMWWTHLWDVVGQRGATAFIENQRADFRASLMKNVSGDIMVWNDPTLFSRPHHRGFSGEIWGKLLAVEHQLIDWDEQPRLLENEEEALGAAFHEGISDHLAFFSDIPPRDIPEPMIVETPALPIRQQSSFIITGPLSARALVRGMTLPSMPHQAVLRDSELRVGINAEGYVMSAVIAGRTNLADPEQQAADKKALDLIKGVRFKPLPRGGGALPGDLQWGNILFRWHTVAASPSNSS